MKQQENQKDYVLLRIPRQDYDKIKKAGFKPGEFVRVLLRYRLNQVEPESQEEESQE
jgi:hypothetical protein